MPVAMEINFGRKQPCEVSAFNCKPRYLRDLTVVVRPRARARAGSRMHGAAAAAAVGRSAQGNTSREHGATRSGKTPGSCRASSALSPDCQTKPPPRIHREKARTRSKHRRKRLVRLEFRSRIDYVPTIFRTSFGLG